MATVSFDRRLLAEPYALDINPGAFTDFSVAACEWTMVHAEAMDPLRVNFTAATHKRRLGHYTRANQTAHIYVPSCVNYARGSGLDPAEVINSVTIHEIGHHLVPNLASLVLRLSTDGLLNLGLGTMSAMSFTAHRAEGPYGSALPYLSLLGAVCAAGSTFLRGHMYARFPGTNPMERAANEIEQTFASRYRVVSLAEFQPVPYGA